MNGDKGEPGIQRRVRRRTPFEPRKGEKGESGLFGLPGRIGQPGNPGETGKAGPIGPTRQPGRDCLATSDLAVMVVSHTPGGEALLIERES